VGAFGEEMPQPLQRLVETIPTDEWDIPLDVFASPEGLEIFRR